MDWFYNFPDMSRSDLRDFKKSVDFAFTDFSRTYGEAIESFFEPLLMFLVWFEKFFINTPWPLIVLGIIFLAWVGSRSLIVVLGTFISFMLIGYFGMWEDTMSTLAIILVATFLCISIGIQGIYLTLYSGVHALQPKNACLRCQYCDCFLLMFHELDKPLC